MSGFVRFGTTIRTPQILVGFAPVVMVFGDEHAEVPTEVDERGALDAEPRLLSIRPLGPIPRS
jgi:hypothetical protein